MSKKHLIIGCGGAGISAIENMEPGVQFDKLAIGSSPERISSTSIANKIYIDRESIVDITKHQEIKSELEGPLHSAAILYDKIFIILGLGGETGSFLYKILPSLLPKYTTYAFIPFKFESERLKKAQTILSELANQEAIKIELSTEENNISLLDYFDTRYKYIYKSIVNICL